MSAQLPEDEQCGCSIVLCCSKKSKRCACSVFQALASPKCALVLFCTAQMMLHTVMSGLLSVVISTLEKRFELQSTESGFIASSLEITSILALIVISFMGEDVDKPAWIGWGVFISGIGSLLFTLPHFIAPAYSYVETETFNFCGNVTASDCSQSNLRHYRYVLMLAMGIFGIGINPMNTHAITYLDENVKKEYSSMYNGIYHAASGLGPALGYLCGGAILELYTDIATNRQDLTIDSSSYLWIGAWWLGFLLCGFILVLGSIPLLMLPKYLPGTQKHRRNRNAEVQKNMIKESEITKKMSGVAERWSDIVLLLKNKPFLFTSFGVTVNAAFIYGFNTFGAKYLESSYGLTAFHAAVLYGIAAIFASTGGHIAGGVVVSRFAPTVRGILKLMIWFGAISALCSLGFMVHCSDMDFAGATVPYFNETTVSESPFSSCNANCDCSTDRYGPVCGGDGVTYFSPCFAGCSTIVNDSVYLGCSCIASADNTSAEGVALMYSCKQETCAALIPFIFIVFLCFITSIVTYPMSTQVTLRCVPFDKRTLAMALQRAVVLGLGILPGRILTGAVLDLACATWSTECGERGSCRSYKRWDLARNTCLLLLAQTVTCVVCYVLVYVTYHPVKQELEDEKKDKQENQEFVNEVNSKNDDVIRLTQSSEYENEKV